MTFHVIVSLHEMSKSIFLGKDKKYVLRCRLLKFLPSMLSFNDSHRVFDEKCKHTYLPFKACGVEIAFNIKYSLKRFMFDD